MFCNLDSNDRLPSDEYRFIPCIVVNPNEIICFVLHFQDESSHNNSLYDNNRTLELFMTGLSMDMRLTVTMRTAFFVHEEKISVAMVNCVTLPKRYVTLNDLEKFSKIIIRANFGF